MAIPSKDRRRDTYLIAHAYFERSRTWARKGEHDKAIEDYKLVLATRGKSIDSFIEYFCSEAIKDEPDDAFVYYMRGDAWHAKGEYDKAIEDYNQAIKIDAECTSAYNSRAWIWATCPEASLRDGRRAVESAQRACELTAWKNPKHIGTLAAAYAEHGAFEAAVLWQEKAIDLADASEKEDFRTRLELYRSGKAYRDAPIPSLQEK